MSPAAGGLLLASNYLSAYLFGLPPPQVAARLNHTPKWTTTASSAPPAATTPTPASKPYSPPPKLDQPARVGQSLGSVRSRNPLDLIKV